jgi:hypothetical protein
VRAAAVLNAERIKLWTTRAPVWCAGAVVVLSLGPAVVQGKAAYDASELPPEAAGIGVAVLGVPVLMILASVTVTSEYRNGLINTTFMATPNRALVLVAKAVVAMVFSSLFTSVMVIASILVARFAAPPLVGDNPSLTDPSVYRFTGAVAAYAALGALLGVGVGAVLRTTSGAVAVLLLWPLAAEPMVGNLPNLGPEVGPYLPFANAFVFIRMDWLYPFYDMRWGEWGSILYFACVAAAVFVAALVTVNKRDA